jgi:hypothetical protein
LVGIATVVLVNVGVGVAIMNGFGSLVMHGPVESEVVIIEEVVEVEDEPPPPPPIDVSCRRRRRRSSFRISFLTPRRRR